VRNGEFVLGELVPGTRYRLLGLVGKGGMGLVYEVEHIELGKRFVLKALLSDLAMREDLVTRLRNEQRALGRLEHPNIVAVTDAGATQANVPFFVMERLDGETLASRLRRERRLSPPEALRVTAGVLEGLAAAHEIGIVHRDVKPPNIFLAGGTRPKILDFGVAKIAHASGAITARGVAVGTPRYMSPEQASGEPVDGRSDLYAVGLVLFEMIAGAGPFDDTRDANEMLLAHLGRKAPDLTALAPNVRPELAGLVGRLLAKEPSARPENARAAVSLLRAVERLYGAVVAPDAPTPLATTSPTPGSVRTAELWSSTGDPRRGDTLTLARGAAPPSPDTLIDDRGSTLAPETAHGTRTELLTAVTAPSGQTETNTRLPITPPDGDPTIQPVPLDGRAASRPPEGVRRRLPVLLGAAAAVAALALLLPFALPSRGGTLPPSKASSPAGGMTSRGPAPGARAPTGQPADGRQAPAAAPFPAASALEPVAAAGPTSSATASAPPAPPVASRAAGPSGTPVPAPAQSGDPPVRPKKKAQPKSGLPGSGL
jgi:serine/threonine protein kinase